MAASTLSSTRHGNSHPAGRFQEQHIPLISWPSGEPPEGKVVCARHRLADTGLFDDAGLLALFDEHDPDDLMVYRMGDDHRQLDDFEYGARGSLSADELLQAVRAGQLWLNIVQVNHHHDVFDQLVESLYDELESMFPGFHASHRNANLLVSSPRAKVYYHADAPLNMLWHVRGRKRVWVYPQDERFAPRAWVEKIFTRESDDDLPYTPEFDEYARAYDLEPGQMLTWPQNTPHRVENLEGLNVSLTTEHYTPDAMRKRMTYLANHYLQRWLGLPTTDVSTRGVRPAMKRTAFRVLRRLPGFHEHVEIDDQSKFELS